MSSYDYSAYIAEWPSPYINKFARLLYTYTCVCTHTCMYAHRLVGQKLNRKKYFMDWTNINTVHVHKIIIFMLVISTPKIITARAGSNYVHCNCNCN